MMPNDRCTFSAQVVVPVISQCKEVETCLECSAKNLIYVNEVFYYALKAVVYPVAPLFDVQAHDGNGALRPLCVKALRRIFLMCDRDKVRAHHAHLCRFFNGQESHQWLNGHLTAGTILCLPYPWSACLWMMEEMCGRNTKMCKS